MTDDHRRGTEETFFPLELLKPDSPRLRSIQWELIGTEVIGDIQIGKPIAIEISRSDRQRPCIRAMVREYVACVMVDGLWRCARLAAVVQKDSILPAISRARKVVVHLKGNTGIGQLGAVRVVVTDNDVLVTIAVDVCKCRGCGPPSLRKTRHKL